ncbi:MAG: MFS transporter [Acetobacteraceae bacterium]|nr:MFS transporter [Acetobacteraceae bacterium]
MTIIQDRRHVDDTDGLPIPQRYFAILTIALGLIMAVLDGAIANVALPTIARDLNMSPASSIWVVNAYQLAVTVTLLPLAALGDILGYRRVYRFGLVVFTLASLACAQAHSLPELAVARMVQGFGASGIMSVNTALIRFIYPRRMLGTAMGVNALMVAVSSAVGPTVASAILSVASWQWLFYVNVPIGAVALLLGLRTLPRTATNGERFDAISAVLNAAAFGLLIAGIDGLGQGETHIEIVAELALAVGAGTLLVMRQMSRSNPLLPIDLLRIPIFALSICTSICSFAGQTIAYVSLPFYLQDALGRSQVETGLLMTPWPLTVAVIAPIAGRLSDRYAAGLLGGGGMVAMAIGLVLLAALPNHPSTADIIWRMVICGFGFGLFQTPNNRAMLSVTPRNRTGAGGGMLSTARLLGQTTGAALVAVVFGLVPTHGTTVTLLVAAGFAVVASGVSMLRLIRPGEEA